MSARSGVRLARPPVVTAVPTLTTFSRLKSIVASSVGLFGPPDFIAAHRARQLGGVDGAGIVIAVLDTGCRASHVALSVSSGDSTSRVLAGRNFTDLGDAMQTSDPIGHGTAISGVVAARSVAPVVAPRAKILPLRIFAGDGHDDLSFTLDALSWLLDEGAAHGPSIVCLSMGDTGNYHSMADVPSTGDGIRQKIADRIRTLRARGVLTVTASGNGYCEAGVTAGPGMCFPAIMPECVSVGATFASAIAARVFAEYGDAATLTSSSPGQITPFSQRLPATIGNPHFTRLVAPGASIRSLGIYSYTTQTDALFGTSVAVPFVAGTVALLQHWYKLKNGGRLPSCDELERWLLEGAEDAVDDAGERDNVDNTGATFKLANAFGAMQAMMAASPSF